MVRNFNRLAAAKLDEALDTGIRDTEALQVIALVGIAQSLARLADSFESLELSAADINLTLQRIERGQA